MSTAAEATAAGAWGRRRLLAVLAAAVLAATATLVGLVYAIYFAVTTASAKPGIPTHGTQASAPVSIGPGQGPAHRDQVAAAPMLEVRPGDARPTAPSALAGPAIAIPVATATGPAGLPSGFPHTPEGAVGQLAAIETTVLQAMSIPQANEVYRQWALPGGVGITGWEMTRNVQSFLQTAEMGQQKDLTTTVVVTPAAAQIKGTDGPDWTLACVLLDVRAIITTDARIGYGYCERMQWHQGRWMIAPGAPPARAPSTWPGSELSTAAGWRTWGDQGALSDAP